MENASDPIVEITSQDPKKRARELIQRTHQLQAQFEEAVSQEMNKRQWGSLRNEATTQAGVINLKGVSVDLKHHELQWKDHTNQLTTTEAKILNFLIDNIGQVLTRQEIARGAWGESYAARTGEVEVYISRLRKKLGNTASRRNDIITTIRGHGYRFQPSAVAMREEQFA